MSKRGAERRLKLKGQGSGAQGGMENVKKNPQNPQRGEEKAFEKALPSGPEHANSPKKKGPFIGESKGSGGIT